MTSVTDRLEERPGIVDRFRPIVDELDELLGRLEIGQEFGVVLNDAEEVGTHFAGLLADAVDGAGRERGVTPHARLLVSRGVAPAARAGDRRYRRVLVFDIDLDAVDAGDLPVVCVAEDGDVARGDLRATAPAVMVLEVCLRDALAGQVRGRRLTHPRRRRLRGRRHFRGLGLFLEDVANAVVRDALRRGELRPQGRLGVVRRRVVSEPLLDPGTRRDDDRRSGSLLSLGQRDLFSVLMIRNTPNRQVEEFARPRAEIPRQRDERPVASVPADVEHRLDVVFPPEHLRGVRRRIVRRRVATGHPLDRVGLLVAVGREFAEHPEGDAVVFVRLRRAVLFAVDPADDLLGGVALLEGVREAATPLRDDEVPSQEKLVTLVGVLRAPEKLDAVAHVEDRPSVRRVGRREPLAPRAPHRAEQLDVVLVERELLEFVVADLADLLQDVSVESADELELASHDPDSAFRVVAHADLNSKRGHLKVWYRTLPGHYSKTLHAHSTTPRCGVEKGVSVTFGSATDTPHAAVQICPRGVAGC